MKKSIFVAIGFLVYSCGVDGEINYGKKNLLSKIDPDNDGNQNSPPQPNLKNGSVIKQKKVNHIKKGRPSKVSTYITTTNNKRKEVVSKFYAWNSCGHWEIKVSKEGGGFLNLSLATCTVIEKEGIFRIQDAKNRINGTLNAEGVDFLLRGSLSGLVAKSTEDTTSGAKTYRFYNNYTAENKKNRKEYYDKWRARQTENKTAALDDKKNKEVIALLGKSFFTSIAGENKPEHLLNCLNFMKKNITLDTNLANELKLNRQGRFTIASVLNKICAHWNINPSFVSSICNNLKKDGLEFFFYNFMKLDFLDALKNLLNKKDNNQKSLFSISNFSSICNGKGFKEFKNLMLFLEDKENLKMTAQLMKKKIFFDGLSSICHARGLENFKNLINWLKYPVNLKITTDLRLNGRIFFNSLSSISNGKGFEDFKKLIDCLNNNTNLKIIKDLNVQGIYFHSLSSICNGKGFEDFENLISFFKDTQILDKINSLKEIDISFETLSQKCNRKGSIKFMQLIEKLDENINYLRHLKDRIQHGSYDALSNEETKKTNPDFWTILETTLKKNRTSKSIKLHKKKKIKKSRKLKEAKHEEKGSERFGQTNENELHEIESYSIGKIDERCYEDLDLLYFHLITGKENYHNDINDESEVFI